MIPEQENLKDSVDFTGGRLWYQQHEEELDEGEFLEGHEDVEEVQDKEPDVEEQSLNSKSGGIEGQSGAEGNKLKDSAEQPLHVEQPNNSELSANPINNPSLAEMNEPIEQVRYTGDPRNSGEEVQQQQFEGIQKDSKKQQKAGQGNPGDESAAITHIQDVISYPNPQVITEVK